NERHNVCSTQPWVCTHVPGEINACGCFAHTSERGAHGYFDWRNECDDRTVMRWIARHIEDMRTVYGGNGVTNGVDDDRVAALGEVWNAFDEWHGGRKCEELLPVRRPVQRGGAGSPR